MKKLFTLVFAAFVAVSVFAQSRITLWEGEKTLDSGWPNVEVSEFRRLCKLMQTSR
jgi:hypothetical protein